MGTNPIQQRLQAAVELDRRRQKQVANQIEIINRLLEGHSYDDVMKNLVEKLSATQAELEALQEEIRR